MSLLLAALARSSAPTAAEPETYQERVLSYAPDWYLPLSETGGTTATAQAGPNGTYVNTMQFGVDPITNDDATGKSVGFSGATTSTPHVTCSSPLVGANLTIDLVVQLDDLTRKHVLVTTLGGSVDGEFSFEVLSNGRPRAWSVSGGIARTMVGGEGDVPEGRAVKLTYQRQSDVAGWSQRILVDGVIVAQDIVQRTWAAVPAGTVYIGTWWDGASFLDPADGLLAHVAGWNSVVASATLQDLVRAKTVAWAVDFDAGSVAEGASKAVSVRQGGWHGQTPLTATAGNTAGGTATTTEAGDQITITGVSEVTDASFTYSFTDAGGLVSATKAVTIDVTAASGPSAGEFAARFPANTSAPAGANVWVAPGGTASYPGTEGAPMGSLVAALNAASPGDVIAMRFGAYTGASVRNQTLINLDFSSNPVEVIGWGSTSERARIDLSISKFRGGTPGSPTNAWTQIDAGKDIWEENVATNLSGETHGFYFGNNEKLALLAYDNTTAFTDTTYASSTRYCGPGMISVGGKIRIRTETAFWSSFTGHGNVPSNKNPNQQDIIVFSSDSIFTFNDCKGIHFQFVEFQHCLRAVEFQDACDDITFTDCVFSGQYEYIRCDMEGDTGNANAIQFHYCDIGRFLPRYIGYYDWKSSPNSIVGLNGKGDILLRGDPSNSARHPDNWRFENTYFSGTQQAFFLSKRIRRLKILNCVFDGERDDFVSISAGTQELEIGYCYIKSYGLGLGRIDGGSSGLNSDPGSIWVHHNVIVLPKHNRFTNTVVSTTFYGVRWILGHGITMSSLTNPFTMKVYHNTIIVSGDEDGVGASHEYRDGWRNNNNLADAQESYNNILVQTEDWQFLRDCGARNAFVSDGNCYHRTTGTSNKFIDMDESNLNRDFSNLAALKADTTFINASKLLYSPGMEASGIETNPNFVGGSSFPLATVADYRPQAAAVKTGAVNITARGFPGASVYQAWRGALDPDGDGSEVGVQAT